MSRSFRRPRGTDTEALNVLVLRQVKKRVDEIAAATGLPQWAVVEAAWEAADPGTSGVPAHWNLPTTNTDALPGVEDRKTA